MIATMDGRSYEAGSKNIRNERIRGTTKMREIANKCKAIDRPRVYMCACDEKRGALRERWK